MLQDIFDDRMNDLLELDVYQWQLKIVRSPILEEMEEKNSLKIAR